MLAIRPRFCRRREAVAGIDQPDVRAELARRHVRHRRADQEIRDLRRQQ